MTTFNLLDEPWIAVGLVDGGQEELSLLEVFDRATQVSGIRGEIATQDMAILRLLIAITSTHGSTSGSNRSGWQRVFARTSSASVTALT